MRQRHADDSGTKKVRETLFEEDTQSQQGHRPRKVVSENTRAKVSWEPVSRRPTGRAQTDRTQPPCCILKSSAPVSENTRANLSREPVSSRPSRRAQTEDTQSPCCILKSSVREHARKLVSRTGEQLPMRKGTDGIHRAAVLHLKKFGSGVREHARKPVLAGARPEGRRRNTLRRRAAPSGFHRTRGTKCSSFRQWDPRTKRE